MQYFKDSATGNYWAFDEDVVATEQNGVYSFATAAGMPLGKVPATLAPSNAPPEPSPAPPPIAYLPAWLVRQRLAAASLWTQAVGAMSADQQLEFATLEEGIDPGDTTVIALLTAIGADPAVILAPQS
jgi:hypothetical protein